MSQAASFRFHSKILEAFPISDLRPTPFTYLMLSYDIALIIFIAEYKVMKFITSQLKGAVQNGMAPILDEI
jgi:hypothetical protein